MKVVQINAVCGFSSTGRTCVELADVLISNGHECKILYGNGTSDYSHAISVSNKWLVKLNALRARITGNDMGGCFISTYRIIRFLKQYQPDVVHLRNLHAHYVNLPILCNFLAKHDIPTVITLHDCWFYTGGCTHYTAAKCYRWQDCCHNCPGYTNGIKSWFYNNPSVTFKKKKSAILSIPRLAVIGVSDWITNEARKSFLQKATILKRIYNWIDTSVFYPRSGNLRQHFNLPEEKFLVLCIGAGWHANTSKCRDLQRLAEGIPDNMRIILAGYVAPDIQLPDSVIKVGYISDTEKLTQLYSVADAYVHLSQEDTFGKVIAEAMACGTSTVVYDATACPEVVNLGNGCIVKSGDIGAIIENLRIIQNTSCKSSIDTAVANTKMNFDKKTLISETIELYTNLVQ